MEIRVEKGKLMKGLGLVGNVTSQKPGTIPILGNILMEAGEKDSIQLVGTDLEVGISTKVQAEVLKEGSITVPAKKILEIVRELPECQIEISVAKNNAVNIKAAKSYFKIMGLTKEDYPKLPEGSPNDAISIPQSLLKDCLILTSFAISYDETRYVLNGVLMKISKDKIRFVATDGRRLAYAERDFDNAKGKELDMIVPIKAIHELNKMLSWEGTVQIFPSQNQVIFYLDDICLTSRLIEGNFPNYEQVIPRESSTKTDANREELLQAIRRTAILTSADSPAVKMDFVKGKILISARSPNLGEAREELDAETQGGEIAIGFNPQYFIDVLKNLDTENVSISLTHPDKPGLVEAKDGYKYVVMPMQLI